MGNLFVQYAKIEVYLVELYFIQDSHGCLSEPFFFWDVRIDLSVYQEIKFARSYRLNKSTHVI